MGASLNIITLPDVAEMHDAVFQHVKTTSHRELVLADESIVQLVGIACAQCETLWNAPHPGGLLSMCKGRVKNLWAIYRTVQGPPREGDRARSGCTTPIRQERLGLASFENGCRVVTVDTRQRVIDLLEKALQAAREGRDLPEVGQIVVKASEVAGVPQSLVQLARETRAKGHGVEADILGLAIDVASNADKQGEVYEHALISIHDLACDQLDELHDAKHHKPKEAPKEAGKTVSRLN